jgi:adenine-specific DNA-methyltransferase
MDELFGREAFVACIVWEKSYTRENRTDVSITHDYILVYAPDRRAWAAKRNLLPPTEEQVGRYSNPDNDPRGDWKALPAHAKAGPGRRAAQFYPVRLPSGRVVNPPPGNCWRYTADRFQEMVNDGRVWFGRDGDGVPAIKRFLSEVPAGLVPVTIWPYEEVGTTGTAKNEILQLFPGIQPFATPKPEALIARIVEIASNEGDVVLDCFAGSGTTAAVAHKMRRRWIAVEREAETIETFASPRLAKVVEGADPGGVTNAASWEGGGGFRTLRVAPSMFRADGGQIFLSEWATNGKLAEVTAAQLHYDFEFDPPFCGRRGRSRLAVIDGLLNEHVIQLLISALPDDERLVACGTAIDPAARDALRKLRPGSTLRKIPQSILQEYRLAVRARPSSLDSSGSSPEAKPVVSS